MNTHRRHRHTHKHGHGHGHGHGHRHTHGIDWRDLFARYFGAICIAAMITVLGLCGFAGWSFYQSHLYASRYGPELEKELGFKLESPSIMAGDAKANVVVIHPVHDGYMDKIGFRDGDIITSHSMAGFYKMLYTQREKTVAVEVVNGGNGLPIAERKVRTLRFLDPPKR